MRYLKIFLLYIVITAIATAIIMQLVKPKTSTTISNKIIDTITVKDSLYKADTSNSLYINTGTTQPQQIVSYAEEFIGTPYVYASTNPKVGFDCSGFITHVFNHFNITVPRTSVEFTNVPHEVPLQSAKAADLILFTGTDSTEKIVGHMGIIVQNLNDSITFIHSSSGKANGVTITPLNDYYKSRYVKIVRVFPQNR